MVFPGSLVASSLESKKVGPRFGVSEVSLWLSVIGWLQSGSRFSPRQIGSGKLRGSIHGISLLRLIAMTIRLPQCLAVLLLSCWHPPPFASEEANRLSNSWSMLLERWVVTVEESAVSRVDYAAAQEDSAELQQWLATCAKVSESAFNDWSVPHRQAFLINLYNAAMMQKILQRYPDIDSVWDFGRIFNHPFKDRFVELFGERMSLDDIEHGRLRGDPALFDPRVHFAVNCASKGCPPLRPTAFDGASIDTALDEQASIFLSDQTKNGMNPTTNRLILSPIFDWYAEDFGEPGLEGQLAYLSRYADSLGLEDDAVRALNEGSIKIEWSDYDWALNDVTSVEQPAP